MRSVALAFVSTLLLSPISVLATYGEHGHHPDHAQHSEEASHAVSKVSDQSTSKVARIVVTVDFLESDVKYVCNREKETCLEQHKCHKKDESCGQKNKCHEKKNKCFKNYNCSKKSKICHKKTTNRYGFRCGKKFYKQGKILSAAKAACREIGANSQRGPFPAIHTAFDFGKPGPYVEWPVNKKARFFHNWGASKRRIVMNLDCGVVGAVVRHKGGDYTECRYERH